MANNFFDSSALIKFYHVEIGSPVVERIIGEVGSNHFIARLTLVEIASGIAKMVRMGVIPSHGKDLLKLRFEADIDDGLLRPARMLNEHFKIAAELLERHAVRYRLRALDSIPLAVALHLDRVVGINCFICADHDLCAVAQIEGLNVVNPTIL